MTNDMRSVLAPAWRAARTLHGARLAQPLLARPPLVLGVRPIVIQQRFFLKPFIRLARSGVAVATGAAAGTAAYAQYKLEEASSSVREGFNTVSDWLKSALDIEHESVDYSDGGSDAVSGGGDGGGGGAVAGGGSEGGGPSGGEGGGGDVVAAAIAGLSSGDDETRAADADDEDQMIGLTRQMIEIRALLTQIDGTERVRLPSIVVVGSQSSGKSSVLEAIVGHEFLPKGSNMVTKRPIELTLVHTGSGETEYCEFPGLHLKHDKFTDFKDVQRMLFELNKAVDPAEVVSADPIRLRVYSPHVPDLTLIDLPGYIQVVAADQPLALRQKIVDLCDAYIQPPNVILAVSAADVDLANSTALQACRRVDPAGTRTIGVITKMDLVDAARGAGTLQTREYPLKMGYVGVVTQTPKRPVFGGGAVGNNMTQLVAQAESGFFNKPEYTNVDWGVLRLRKKLTTVLGRSMAESLGPATQDIKRELEETAYKYKVQYDDRILTPNTYLAQCADEFKAMFKELSSQFGRDQVRNLIKQVLDQKGLDLLAEKYWNVPGELATPAVPLEQDMLQLQTRLDEISAQLTKSGVGRLATLMLVDEIVKRMDALKQRSRFRNHPLALEQIDKAVQKIVTSKFYATADQIENSIKPYKYEVDVDTREWAQSREYACGLLAEELRQCTKALESLRRDVGPRKLAALLAALDASEAARSQYSAEALARAREARFLQQRAAVLQARQTFVRSGRCKSRKSRAVCPEVFTDVVTTKLTATAVLFLNFELLSDFYYSFPRELDATLQALSESQVERLAAQDPAIREHVQLQHRKELLQLALEKLRATSDLRELADKL